MESRVRGVKVLVVVKHVIMRRGIKSILDSAGLNFVLLESDSGYRAAEIIKREKPKLVVLDISLPDIEVLTVVHSKYKPYFSTPDVRFLLFDLHFSDYQIPPKINSKAFGLLHTNTSPDELVTAIKNVLHGESFSSSNISPKQIPLLTNTTKAAHQQIHGQVSVVLSKREKQVLKYIHEGMNSKQIAEKLNLGVRTIETYRSRLLEKFDCHSTVKLLLTVNDNEELKRIVPSDAVIKNPITQSVSDNNFGSNLVQG